MVAGKRLVVDLNVRICGLGGVDIGTYKLRRELDMLKMIMQTCLHRQVIAHEALTLLINTCRVQAMLSVVHSLCYATKFVSRWASEILI